MPGSPFLGSRKRRVSQDIPRVVEDRTGMQNGVQVIDILVEMSVQIRHVLPPNSFRFEDKNPLRIAAEIFKTAFGPKAGEFSKLGNPKVALQ
jgi:hypothetical protein